MNVECWFMVLVLWESHLIVKKLMMVKQMPMPLDRSYLTSLVHWSNTANGSFKACEEIDPMETLPPCRYFLWFRGSSLCCIINWLFHLACSISKLAYRCSPPLWLQPGAVRQRRAGHRQNCLRAGGGATTPGSQDGMGRRLDKVTRLRGQMFGATGWFCWGSSHPI